MKQRETHSPRRLGALLLAAAVAWSGIAGATTAVADDALLDTKTPVTVSGESYGPVTPNKPYSVSAPNAMVKGKSIVITGAGYLATDNKTGSVAAFLIDAEKSGDPNTLYTTRAVTNPLTGKATPDKRLHAIVQAKADGTWRAEIPWPNETNTTKDAAFFAANWKTGMQHSVRILTGSLLSSPPDYQRGISVRFTVVDAVPTPKISGTAKVGSKLTAKPGTWTPAAKFTYQWLRDGKSISKATKSTYTLAKADAGKKISVKVTGARSGYVTESKTSKTVTVAKVKSKVTVTVPKSVAKSKQATIKVAISAAISKPTGTVKTTVNGKTVKTTVKASAKGKVSIKLPKITKKGSYKVKVTFSPSGDTKKSTTTSSSVTKTLKVT